MLSEERQTRNQQIPIPTPLLKDMYRSLLQIRYTEEAIAELVRDEKIDAQGELVVDEQGNVVRMQKEVICPCHLYSGQEAVAVGVCGSLNRDDYVFSNHRCHGHYLAKGGDLNSLMAELFGRKTGCAEGRGGSMHLVAPEIGFPGSTPIVASSIPQAVGAAMGVWTRGESRVVISFFGDGATEEGRFHESLNLAAYLKLPIVFICENNLYSSHVRLEHRRPADTINLHALPFEIPGVRADGNNLFTVYNTAREAIERARSGGGPSLIEYRTYRIHGHVGANLDLEKGIRNRVEFDLWNSRDPIKSVERTLKSLEIMSADEIEAAHSQTDSLVKQAIVLARQGELPDPSELLDNVLATESDPVPSSPILSRAVKGQAADRMQMNLGEAIREATEQLMAVDERVFVIGQGVNSPWYVGNTATGLFKRFGPYRVIDTPISEDSVTGAALGAAMTGMRPIVIHPRVDFGLLATEQLIGQAANWRYMTAGKVIAPMVVRLIVNRAGQQAAQHSQSLQAIFAHCPGLVVVMPSNSYDAKGLMVAAVLSGNPVVYIDDRWTYDYYMDVPKELYAVPLGKGIIRREGSDVTVVATSYKNIWAVKAAEELLKEGISVEVIDPRTLKPLDTEIILNSVAKTGRLLVADGGWDAYGFTAEVAAVVASNPVVTKLKAPIARMGLPECPAPMSELLEKAYYGDVNNLIQRIRKLVKEDV